MSEKNTSESIGNIAIEFGHLDLTINHVFANLVNNDDLEIGLLLAANITSISVKLDYIRKLFNYKFNEESEGKEFKDLYQNIIRVIEMRNEIFHSTWFAETDGKRVAISSTRKREIKDKSYNAQELDTIAREIQQVKNKFLQYMLPKISKS